MGASLTPEAIREAHKHAKKSFFAVDGPGDLFDNVRSAMWRTRDEERSVFTGCQWHEEWTDSPGGVIERVSGGRVFGHAVKAFGWRGERMQLQLSNGKKIGDGGIFWVGREAFSKTFTFGAFTFLDMPREDAEKACWYSGSSTFFGWTTSLFTRVFGRMKP